ncbi:collagenase-like [Drosophila sulfurigaster albostrigata]|uniref:collagenase-like n=1 Tax=Drosophila sulfurigaster albostrigata TaxID=89887 RepID=UPI002D21A657|nr:collagenase-like [Drosophila sulfurigaster albostrigata]
MKVLVVFGLALVYVSASVHQDKPEIYHHNELQDISNVEIINGHNASPRQFPYQVKLSIKEGKKYFQCSGSLISHNWVLTAAQCTSGADSVEVFLGGIESSDFLVKFLIKSKYIIVHKDWDDYYKLNDISLIRIPYMEYSEYIKPVELPKIQPRYKTYAGSEAIVTGWGTTSKDSTTFSKILQYGTVKIINNKRCSDTFATIKSFEICTSDSKISFCDGDGGSPLVISNSSVQVGIASFLPDNCASPNGFTRVTRFLKWIKRHTGLPL